MNIRDVYILQRNLMGFYEDEKPFINLYVGGYSWYLYDEDDNKIRGHPYNPTSQDLTLWTYYRVNK